MQPGSSLHFPAVECLRDAVCSRALAGTVLPGPPMCPRDPAVTPGSLLGGWQVLPGPSGCGCSGASAASPRWGQPPAAAALPRLPAVALALRAASPGLVVSGLVREVTVCSSSSSISTALRRPGLPPRQQRGLHGGGRAGRAAAGAAQARRLAGLLQPAGTWDAASGPPRLVPLPRPAPGVSSALVGSARLPSRHGPRWLSAGGTSVISSTFISKRWRLQRLSPAVGCGVGGKGCVLCPGWAGGLAAACRSPPCSALRTLFAKSCCLRA